MSHFPVFLIGTKFWLNKIISPNNSIGQKKNAHQKEKEKQKKTMILLFQMMLILMKMKMSLKENFQKRKQELQKQLQNPPLNLVSILSATNVYFGQKK
jgi:hypothetical protein